MKLGFSQQEIIGTAKSLGLPTDGFIQRRVARAFDLVETDKVNVIDDGIFRVRSQYDPSKAYIVNLNGDWGCDCPDHQKNTGAGCDASLRRRLLLCKHMIASMLYAQKQAQEAITIIKTTDGNEGDYWRRCWLIAKGNRRTLVYEERDRRLFCTCGAYYNDCEHKQLVISAGVASVRCVDTTPSSSNFPVRQAQSSPKGVVDEMRE